MKTVIAVFAAVMSLACSCAVFAADTPGLSVSPTAIEMGAFYDGTTLTATGRIPQDSDVVLSFVGQECDVPIKQKGKVFGLMWMNLDSLVIRKVPGVCLVSSCSGLGEQDGNSKQDVGMLGLSGIRKDAEIECNGSNRDTVFDEFLKLKKSEGLYRELVGNVSYKPAADGFKSFTARIPIPAKLSPGQYRLEMAVLKDGKITERTGANIDARMVGLPAILWNLAFKRSALYGILSTLIALVAGLAVGLVFQSKGAH